MDVSNNRNLKRKRRLEPSPRLDVSREIASDDGRSIKFRWTTHDSLSCECVALFPRPTRATACISSQVGCAVGCVFCATGRMGLLRNLNAEEILSQVSHVAHQSSLRCVPLRNVVFMGMGEPFHNYDAVVDSVDQIVAPKGFGIGPRHVTISTAGVPGKMLDFALRFPKVRQALSLHSAIPEKRRRLVPRAVGDPDLLRATIAELNRLIVDSPIWLEYVLMENFNDGDEDVEALIEFCSGLRVEVNVIPFNSISSSWPPADRRSEDTSATELGSDTLSASNSSSPILNRPPDAVQDAFIRKLRRAGLFTTLRKSLGQSIAAACGQLASP